MEKVFGAVLHLSLIGSYTVLLVVLLRFLMLKVLHCSRKLAYGLWLLVFLNFCVPTGYVDSECSPHFLRSTNTILFYEFQKVNSV